MTTRLLGVVHNGLGSDEELAQVINRLCHNVNDYFDNPCLSLTAAVILLLVLTVFQTIFSMTFYLHPTK